MADETGAAGQVTDQDIDALGVKLREFARDLPPGEQGALMQLIELALGSRQATSRGEVEAFGQLASLGVGARVAISPQRIDLKRIGVRGGARAIIIC